MKNLLTFIALLLVGISANAQSFTFSCHIGGERFDFTPSELDSFSLVTSGPSVNVSSASASPVFVTYNERYVLLSYNPSPNWGLMADLEDFDFSILYNTDGVWGRGKADFRYLPSDYYCSNDPLGTYILPNNISWTLALNFLIHETPSNP